MILFHLIALTCAVLIDLIIGDPPNWPHPVKWFGSLIGKLENRWNKGVYQKEKGLIMVLTVLVVVGGTSFLLVVGAYFIHPLVGIGIEAILIATTIAQKGLKEAALTIFWPLEKNDLVEARVKLSYIVGRDTQNLREEEITRGAVETVAENTSDGITALCFGR